MRVAIQITACDLLFLTLNLEEGGIVNCQLTQTELFVFCAVLMLVLYWEADKAQKRTLNESAFLNPARLDYIMIQNSIVICISKPSTSTY